MSLATQTGSSLIDLEKLSTLQYLSFSVWCHSSVHTSLTSHSIVSIGLVTHCSVAVIVFNSDCGVFAITCNGLGQFHSIIKSPNHGNSLLKALAILVFDTGFISFTLLFRFVASFPTGFNRSYAQRSVDSPAAHLLTHHCIGVVDHWFSSGYSLLISLDGIPFDISILRSSSILESTFLYSGYSFDTSLTGIHFWKSWYRSSYGVVCDFKDDGDTLPAIIGCQLGSVLEFVAGLSWLIGFIIDCIGFIAGFTHGVLIWPVLLRYSKRLLGGAGLLSGVIPFVTNCFGSILCCGANGQFIFI